MVDLSIVLCMFTRYLNEKLVPNGARWFLEFGFWASWDIDAHAQIVGDVYVSL